jgi:hypothetical protein
VFGSLDISDAPYSSLPGAAGVLPSTTRATNSYRP